MSGMTPLTALQEGRHGMPTRRVCGVSIGGESQGVINGMYKSEEM